MTIDQDKLGELLGRFVGDLGATIAAMQSSHHVAVHAGHMLDVKSGKMLSDQTLVIEDGKVVSSGASADAKVPPDAVRIELPNATVLPGFIDAHNHFACTAETFGAIDAGPASVVEGGDWQGPDSSPIVAVKIFIEQNIIFEMRIGLKFFIVAKHGASAIFITKKNS